MEVPTLDGQLELLVAPNTSPSTVKVLKGRGPLRMHQHGSHGDIVVHFQLSVSYMPLMTLGSPREQMINRRFCLEEFMSDQTCLTADLWLTGPCRSFNVLAMHALACSIILIF